MTDTIQITPNTVIPDSDVRRRIGNVLWILSLLAGVAALFFAFFPEAAFGTDLPDRAIAFVNALVSLVTGTFGLVVVRSNTPTKADIVPVAQNEVVQPPAFPGEGIH